MDAMTAFLIVSESMIMATALALDAADRRRQAAQRALDAAPVEEPNGWDESTGTPVNRGSW